MKLFRSTIKAAHVGEKRGGDNLPRYEGATPITESDVSLDEKAGEV